MTIERLRCFAAVTRHMSFTRAAAELHMAQTAVSRQIATLEEELGCRLLERNNRTVGLTPAGERFLEGIGPLLVLYDKTLAETRRVGQAIGGELHIGIGQYEGRFVSTLVKEFCGAYPQTEVVISAHQYQELVNQLLSGTLDVAFALPVSAEYLADKPVELQELFPAKLCLVLRRDHPHAGEKVFLPEWFRGERLISLSEEEGPCSLAGMKKKVELWGLALKEVRCVNSLESMLLMVEAGMGMGVVPDFLQGELSEKFALLSAPAGYPGRDQFVAIRRAGRQKHQVDAFWSGIASSHTLLEQVRRLRDGEA